MLLANTSKVVKDQVKHLQKLNLSIARNRYEVAQILFGLHSNRSFELVGSESWYDFIEEFDLGLKRAAVNRHINFYDFAVKRLKYKKSECLEIITKLGINTAVEILPTLDKKEAVSKLVKKKQVLDADHATYGVCLTKSESKRFDKKLMANGMQQGDTGYRIGLSEAVVKMMDQLERYEKAHGKLPEIQTNLRLVG